jgi:hypothetical protein
MRCISKPRDRSILACFGTISAVESPLRVLIASEVDVAVVASVTAREHRI